MKKKNILKILIPFGILIVTIFLASCDMADPTSTENLETTEDKLAEGADGATAPFVVGLEQRVTELINNIAYFQTAMGDDYATVSDGLDANINNPRSYFEENMTGYQPIHDVRALADFVLTKVIPNDKEVTDDLIGLVYFYRGIAFLISGENFIRMPIAPDTPSKTIKERLLLAIDDFNHALELNSEISTAIHILRGRTYRLLGDKEKARTDAEAAISSAPEDYVYFAQMDPNASSSVGITSQSTTVENGVWVVAVRRLTQDLQPNPRLDFLDPKYTKRTDPIPIAKIEEAHLMLAEILLSDGDFPGAKNRLAEAVRIARNRPTVEFVDIDTRLLGIPQVEGVLVKASPTSPAIDGLVLPRSGATVNIPVISGSSQTPDEILALPFTTTEEKVEILRRIYLARQEIFFNEGRRGADLGIRRQMSRVEWEQNDAINPGDPGTEGSVFVPFFIPPGEEMDEWTVDESGPVPVITLKWDMNKVLAENRGNAPVLEDLRMTLPFNYPF